MPPDPAALATVRALDALWQELGSRSLWARDRWWRTARLRLRYRLRPLDPERVRLLIPPWQTNDCASCTDLCCVGPRSTVLLHLRDIATLVDLGRTDLISRAKPAFAAADLAGRPALQRRIRSRAWQVLPTVASDRMHACRALNRDGQCTLYPHWPLSCARFPYSLHLEEMQVFYSQRCQSYWIRPQPASEAQVRRSAHLAVEAYNESIRDILLTTFARAELDALGIGAYLAGSF